MYRDKTISEVHDGNSWVHMAARVFEVCMCVRRPGSPEDRPGRGTRLEARWDIVYG
jgi:hypothetical protein